MAAVPGCGGSIRLSLPSPVRYHYEVSDPLRVPVVGIAAASLLLGVTVSDGVRADIYQSEGADGVLSFSSNRAPGSRLVAKDRSLSASPFMPQDTNPERFHRYDAAILEAATLYQIPVELIRAVTKVESDFDPRAVSRANACGLMQLIPSTAERMMVRDIFDPRQNILGGTRYLRILANTFNGDIQLTVAAYNAGEGAVMRHGGIPPYEETQAYVAKVLSYYRQYRAASLLGNP